MPGLDIRPFEDVDVEAAAALLRERHARHRAAVPLLADVRGFRPAFLRLYRSIS